jgi:hypothetical protein
MKILVATKDSQGQRASDFSFTNAGELVCRSIICGGGDEDNLDGGCGCQRSMVGLVTRKGTTTVKVVSRKMTRADLVNSLVASYARAYRLGLIDADMVQAQEQEADELIRIANRFKIGDVLEIRGRKIQARKPL